MKLFPIVLIVISSFLVGGCATLGGILNPYEDRFMCPPTEPGKCIPVREAYEKSLVQKDKKQIESRPEEVKVQGTDVESKSLYRQALYRELAGILEEPITPMVALPKIMRVLVLPYTGKNNELFMMRYVYFFVGEPEWVLSGNITEREQE